MVSTEAIRFVVGVIGNIISFGLFTAPIKTMIRIFRNKSTEEFQPYPYIGTVMNCLLWVFYGLPFVHPDSTLVVTINSFGLFVELCYLLLFLIYGSKSHRKQVVGGLLVETVLMAIIVSLTLSLAHTTVRRSQIVGVLCVVFGIVMYSMPLGVMRAVIRTKSVEYMPFLLSLACFLNGLVWLVYALLKFDLFILVSNGVGAFLGLVQLILYAIYKRTTPKKGKDGNVKPSEVQLQTPV